ncbi:MAG: hypothetical protein J5I50_12455 [Chitinophagaceae bacterium]|nr:hypothetical protein [Chitinophagaceae bacterium]
MQCIISPLPIPDDPGVGTINRYIGYDEDGNSEEFLQEILSEKKIHKSGYASKMKWVSANGEPTDEYSFQCNYK